jgi:hypothetical protein
MLQQPILQAFFDEPTNIVSYLVADRAAANGVRYLAIPVKFKDAQAAA